MEKVNQKGIIIRGGRERTCFCSHLKLQPMKNHIHPGILLLFKGVHLKKDGTEAWMGSCFLVTIETLEMVEDAVHWTSNDFIKASLIRIQGFRNGDKSLNSLLKSNDRLRASFWRRQFFKKSFVETFTRINLHKITYTQMKHDGYHIPCCGSRWGQRR